jgi:hypothetical protein
VHALVLSFIVALVLHMRSACCSIAWFPGIVPVGFLLAEVRPPTIIDKFGKNKEFIKENVVAKTKGRLL